MNDAIKLVRQGGIIIYPTDTAFGIGCRIDYPQSVDRLFKLRKRSDNKATPVLVDSITMALAYFDSPPDIVRHLIETYWPGALTIISRCKKNLVYSPIIGGTDRIGLRIPNHSSTLSIITGVGVPIIGCSANFSGKLTPFMYKDLDPALVKLVDYVVPGECTIRNVSTVVDCSEGDVKIIRQGAVNIL